VVYAVNVLQQGPEFGSVGYVATGEEHIWSEPAGIPGREVIKPPNLVPFPDESIGKRRPKETCGACD
jgi:hypothetical protein